VATPKQTARPVQRTTEPTKQHRLPGMKTSSTESTAKETPADAGLDDLLGVIGQNAEEKPQKKGEKPVITLEGKAAELLELQRCKAEEKTLEGRIKQLEGELSPEIEARRQAINIAKNSYIGSLYVQATGKDEEGNDIQAGQALYYVQHRYSGYNPHNLSKDDDLQTRYKGKAKINDEAIEAIMAKLEVDRPTAEAMLKERTETENNVSLQEGALKNPEVIKILRDHLAKWLVSDTHTTPTVAFHEKSNYNEVDMKIMQALNEIGLFKRAKATIKASGAPDQYGG